MRRYLAVAAVSLVVLAGCTDDDPPPDRAVTSPASARACPAGWSEPLSAWAGVGFSGSIAVSTGGRIDCHAAYGLAEDSTSRRNTAGTVFSIGSITKAFTAAAIFRLAEDGKLTLDDRVGRHLPELTGPIGDATVRELLLHTSGLNGTHGNDLEPMSRERALAAIGKLQLTGKPGRRYLYSNAGYTLLAMMVEKASGSAYRDYLSARILPLPGGRPAGGFWNGEPSAPPPRAVGHLEDGAIGERGDFAGPYWAVEGNGGLAMTMPDLAAWTHALFTGRIVSARSAETISTPGHDLGDGRGEAFGWVAYDESAFGLPFLATAGGGGDIGHNAVVVWVPKQHRVIAMASNKPEISAEDLLAKIGPAIATGKPLPRPSRPPGGGVMAATAGTYRLPLGGTLTVAVDRDRMSITAEGADAAEVLFPRPAGVPEGDFRKHESMVTELLAGRTDEGRKERAHFEKEVGRLDDVRLAGTIVYGGELRTYVKLISGGRPTLGWFSLNDAGGVEAAEVPAGRPPTLEFLPAGENRYEPDDPTGVRPEVTVTFDGDRLVATGPAGPHSARRAG